MRTPSLTATLRLIPAKWPQFSLGTLFITVTLVSITLGWYIPRVQNERRAADAVRAAGGNIVYDWQVLPENCPPDYQPDPPGPNIFRNWFGAHWFDSIARVELNGNELRNGKNNFDLVGPHLLRLDELRGLQLWTARLDDKCYVTIGQLPHLEDLTIALRDELTRDDAARLANNFSLRRLHLVKAHISATALREFARMPRLTELVIECDAYYPQTGNVVEEYKLRDDDADMIGELQKLRKLSLRNTKITDEGVASICRLSNLELLSISSPMITSSSFDSVAKLKQLRYLGTWGWQINNADFEKLIQLPNLTSLWLITRDITDESMPYIVRLPHIKHLSLSGDGITDASLPHLQQVSALEWLDLNHTAVNKLSQAADDLRTALPNCKMLLPRTPQEEAMHEAFIASKWSGGNSVIYQPKSTAPASTTSKKD